MANQRGEIETLRSNLIGMRALAEALGIDAPAAAGEPVPPSRHRSQLVDPQLRCELRLSDGRAVAAGGPSADVSDALCVDLDLHQYSWGDGLIAPSTALATPITVPRGTGEFILVATPSPASPVLFGAMITGEVFDRVLITVSRATPAGSDVDFLCVELSDAMVCGFREFGVGTAAILETITLTYTQLRYVYYPQNTDGSYGVPAMGRWSRKTS
ncbi:type VI secretion system tube protein Hcp [Jatrophihabitans sp. GAS493]|uniref:type VI secretion system tube protein Hcp n=1 Tax=Jatrophihabitans sp. GAS493 TaxID=1907575 RepID=UPI0012FE4C2A|nr:type VI secretion system tube protein Hcp [Jatrophihabitans sp. GAS493]